MAKNTKPEDDSSFLKCTMINDQAFEKERKNTDNGFVFSKHQFGTRIRNNSERRQLSADSEHYIILISLRRQLKRVIWNITIPQRWPCLHTVRDGWVWITLGSNYFEIQWTLQTFWIAPWILIGWLVGWSIGKSWKQTEARNSCCGRCTLSFICW